MDTQLHISEFDTLSPQRADEVIILAGGFKPYNAFWTSSLVRDTSAWAEWCREEDYADVDSMYWHMLTPSPMARVYVIDTLDDLVALVGRYPSSTFDEYPDWIAVSRDYDGVRLTEGGQEATRWSRPYNLYGWDCESTVWFRWAFTDCILLARTSEDTKVGYANRVRDQ